MAMQEKLEDMLKNKLSTFLVKYNEARVNFENKQMEIIKAVEPTFEGSVKSFFDTHTIASQSTYYLNKHYDIASQRFVNYDVNSLGVGILYDEIGKKVHARSKRTKEYIVLEYYTNIISSLIIMLDKIQPLEMKLDGVLDDSYSENVVVEETPPQGPKF